MRHTIRRRSAFLWSCLPLTFGCLVGVARAELPEFMRKPSPRHLRVLCYNVNWDSIFEDDDPDNHPWREYDMSDQFVRVVTAVDPDIVCLQEINQYRDAQDVADILDAAVPFGAGGYWRAHKGSDNVIAARWDLSMGLTDTVPSTNRGQAMALIELPDPAYDNDLYLMNAHFKAGGSASDIQRRQQHADAIIHWIGDIKTPGGYIDLPGGTPILVLGDLNVYSTDPHYHLTTLLTGDIVYESTYGADLAPDWDETDSTDTLPLHNGVGPDVWTWRNDGGPYDPGALDRVIYTDSVIVVDKSFVLNTVTMSPEDLADAGLLFDDIVLDFAGGYYDHLPLVVDFYVSGPPGDWDGDGGVDADDFAAFTNTMTGPDNGPYLPAYRSLDFDEDLDIDLRDFAGLQAACAD